MWRAKEAKDEVAKKKAQHAAELEEMRQRGIKEKEIQALREKQEQELAAMKLQALYRGRQARKGLEKKRELRRAELKRKTRENSRQMSATKIQGMYRSWKARKVIRGRKAELKARFEVSNNACNKYTKYTHSQSVNIEKHCDCFSKCDLFHLCVSYLSIFLHGHVSSYLCASVLIL